MDSKCGCFIDETTTLKGFEVDWKRFHPQQPWYATWLPH